MTDLSWMDGGCTMSEDLTMRYTLDRVWDASGRRVLFVMLNPSTADGREDDPTIRKCIGFAKRWGFGSLEVVNLFPWRATDPRDLVAAERDGKPVRGDERSRTKVDAAVRGADAIVVAWGAHPLARGEVIRFVRQHLIGREMMCIGTTADGSPRHPLMTAYATPLRGW